MPKIQFESLLKSFTYNFNIVYIENDIQKPLHH